MIAKAIKVGYESFSGWNLMLNERGCPNVGPFIGICGGFVTRDSQSGELSYSGQYKAYSHILPHLTKESKIRYISTDESFDMDMSAYPKRNDKIEGIFIENPDGKCTAVLVNPNTHGVQAQIEMRGALWYLELAAESISTVEAER